MLGICLSRVVSRVQPRGLSRSLSNTCRVSYLNLGVQLSALSALQHVLCANSLNVLNLNVQNLMCKMCTS